MKRLEIGLENKIRTLHSSFFQLYLKKDFIAGQRFILEAWELLPDPKEDFDESYTLAMLSAENYIKMGAYSQAEIWALKMQNCNLQRDRTGEREYILAKTKFELGKLEEAKALFAVAQLNSESRIWKRGDDKKYETFFKGG